MGGLLASHFFFYLTLISERSYRTQLKKWGFTKYSTQAFPKAKKRGRSSNRLGKRPAITSAAPEGFGSFSLPDNLPATSALDSGRADLDFAASQLPSVAFSVSQFDSFGQGTEAPGPLHTGQYALDGQGRSQLHRAIMSEDVDQVQFLLNAGATVDTRDHTGNTPLHWGVSTGNSNVVKLILQFGADVNAKNNLGRAPLHLGVSQPTLIDTLINQGADASVQDGNGNTPLHLLIYAHPSQYSNLFSSAVEALLKAGAGPNQANHNEETPFFQLLKRQSYQEEVLMAIHSSLQAGGSVNEVLPDGTIPFEIFLSRSETKGFKLGGPKERLENNILRCFLAKGASVITPMTLGEPLICGYLNTRDSVRWGRDKRLGKELFKRLTPGEVEKAGNSILFALVSDYWETAGDGGELIATLLQHGVNPNHQDHLGKSVLLLLFQRYKSKPPVISRALAPLLEHGANPWQRDFAGRCPLFEAAEMFPKERLAWMILEADLRKRQAADSPEPGNDDAAKSEPWDEWQLAVRAVNWSESKELILREHKFPSNKIRNAMRECALGVLAEKHVHLAKDKFQGDSAERELRRQYVAGIIRDCRDRGIALGESCMDYLIDLCL